MPTAADIKPRVVHLHEMSAFCWLSSTYVSLLAKLHPLPRLWPCFFEVDRQSRQTAWQINVSPGSVPLPLQSGYIY